MLPYSGKLRGPLRQSYRTDQAFIPCFKTKFLLKQSWKSLQAGKIPWCTMMPAFHP